MPNALPFTVTVYGDSNIAMDWLGLADPFTQVLPILFNNTWSGTLYTQTALVTPPSRYTAYSGSAVSQESIGTNVSKTLRCVWDVSVSGVLTTSSPITDSLTVQIAIYTSSNRVAATEYSGSPVDYTITNTLFNRDAHIRLFGTEYTDDIPNLLAVSDSGSMSSGINFRYFLSYVRSGWESELGDSIVFSGFSGGGVTLNWTLVSNVQQYYVWRVRGPSTAPDGTGPTNVFPETTSGTLLPVQLLTVTTSGTFKDDGSAGTATIRQRYWDRNAVPRPSYTTASKNSLPSSLRLDATNAPGDFTMGWPIRRNTSGTALSGPVYVTFALNPRAVTITTFRRSTTNAWTLGDTFAIPQVFSGQLTDVYHRYAFRLSGAQDSIQSGVAWFQIRGDHDIDDYYVIAIS